MQSSDNVRYVDMSENDGARAVVYFQALTATPTCVSIVSRRVFHVVDEKDVSIVLYDYYKPNDRVGSGRSQSLCI